MANRNRQLRAATKPGDRQGDIRSAECIGQNEGAYIARVFY